jgi:hypothetical protein
MLGPEGGQAEWGGVQFIEVGAALGECDNVAGRKVEHEFAVAPDAREVLRKARGETCLERSGESSRRLSAVHVMLNVEQPSAITSEPLLFEGIGRSTRHAHQLSVHRHTSTPVCRRTAR